MRQHSFVILWRGFCDESAALREQSLNRSQCELKRSCCTYKRSLTADHCSCYMLCFSTFTHMYTWGDKHAHNPDTTSKVNLLLRTGTCYITYRMCGGNNLAVLCITHKLLSDIQISSLNVCEAGAQGRAKPFIHAKQSIIQDQRHRSNHPLFMHQHYKVLLKKGVSSFGWMLFRTALKQRKQYPLREPIPCMNILII